VKNAPSINSLIQLIDDPDDRIYADVRDKLISHGASVIPFLEDSSERFDYGGLFKTRIQDLIDSIQRDRVYMNMNEWIRGNTKDLLEGALIIARVEYPDFQRSEVLSGLNLMKNKQHLRRSGYLTKSSTVNLVSVVSETIITILTIHS
jgi:hypothetical protein